MLVTVMVQGVYRYLPLCGAMLCVSTLHYITNFLMWPK